MHMTVHLGGWVGALFANCFYSTLLLHQVSDISGGHILCDVIKGAEFKVVEQCGHALTLERPRKTAKIFCEFIQNSLQH